MWCCSFFLLLFFLFLQCLIFICDILLFLLSEASHVSLDSDISEFMPELQSLEAQAALDVPLMSQDPLEVEETKEVSASSNEGSKTTTRRRKGGKGSGDDDSVISPVSAQGMCGVWSFFY